MFSGIRKFIGEVTSELKKVSWSTRSEVIEATWVVLTSTALLGIFIATVDFTLAKFIGVIIR